MYYKLNLPKLELPPLWYTENIQIESKHVQGYISYYVTDFVDSYVRSLFPKNFFPPKTHLIAQVIDPRLNNCIHKDKREFAINYLIQKGGTDASTALYSDDKSFVDSYTQEEGEWYLLNTFNNHAVNNLDSTRLALSISFYEFGDAQWKFIKTLL